ncbi:hypothetical protein CRG98_011693 [Punica granatum]|uniref:Uncharacterized protein n=1 Tax=Punica granatum TaxID=22663 RepID=A0A2I0KHU2_PUNGR|nr:hypothetical protein CRG98_011693 [Punica granatum]
MLNRSKNLEVPIPETRLGGQNGNTTNRTCRWKDQMTETPEGQFRHSTPLSCARRFIHSIVRRRPLRLHLFPNPPFHARTFHSPHGETTRRLPATPLSRGWVDVSNLRARVRKQRVGGEGICPWPTDSQRGRDVVQSSQGSA